MSLDNGLANRQSETGATPEAPVGGFQLLKLVEQLRDVGGSDSGA